jgi:hypothetical protein
MLLSMFFVNIRLADQIRKITRLIRELSSDDEKEAARAAKNKAKDEYHEAENNAKNCRAAIN